MWFNPRALQTQQHTPGDSCDFGDFSSHASLKVAEIAKVAAPSLLKNEERNVILSWLDSIGETNAETITRVIRQCHEDLAIRDYFLRMAYAHKKSMNEMEDDRCYCYQCINLTLSGHCLAVQNGTIKASYGYKPLNDLPFRCEGYKPKMNDLDQRIACERWPGLCKSRNYKDKCALTA